jgi:uncharacterized protein YaiL (DUF2058 family)
MKLGESKHDQQVVKDEAAATVREGARQADIERERALNAVQEATAAAEVEPTAEAASKTFVARMRKFLGL